MNKITLTGSYKGEEVEFDSSKYVKLSDGYYRKDDNLVTKVEGRYFRKESPFIILADERIYGKDRFLRKSDHVVTYKGEIILYDESVEVNVIDSSSEEGESEDDLKITKGFIHNSQGDVRFIFKGGRMNAVFKKEGNYNPKNIVKLFNRNEFIHKNSPFVIKLSDKYGKNPYVLRTESDIVDFDGDLFLKRDCVFSKDPSGEDYRLIKVRNPISGTYTYIDKRENPYANINSVRRLYNSIVKDGKLVVPVQIAWKTIRDWNPEISKVDSDFSVKEVVSKFGFNVYEEELPLANQMYDLIYNSKENKNGLKSISNVLDWFGKEERKNDLDIYINGLETDTGGDYVYFRPKGKTFDRSINTSLTGDIGYTYGVELETSFGTAPKMFLYEKELETVGDRSIGSFEYVTKPLHGNLGIEYLREVCDFLYRYCAVDDRCGVHVHVGGMDGCETPNFNREFSILSIMLGVMIEKEMFELLPSNRMSRRSASGVPYCSSIMDFEETSLSNGEKMLSRYVFGNDSGFTSGQNEDTELHRWVSTRYKWLNLVNCNTKNSGRRGGGGFKTIEFRQYNASLNINDIRAFVLLSLAFTKFVETRKDLILKGSVTIDQMILHTLNSESYFFLSSWISTRRKVIQKIKRNQKIIESKK